ncbi:Clp protease N-terminal domain-containing protein [Streptomyces sp. 3212.3]|uniref:Clp protease N-terminal domain-containing protein n=1 Tax=Streptomyces sp. 3212.3 TaxID=1938846 RepID=UPI000E264496
MSGVDGADEVVGVSLPQSQHPAPERGAHHPDHDPRLDAELAAVVTGARRRAQRDGDRQVDTAHLLHTLLESDPEVRAVFDGPHVARLLGYLVQRAIGYGLRWQASVEDSGAVPFLTESDGWSPAAAGALDAAHGRAIRLGRPLVRGVDLLAAVVAEPTSRAVEVLGRAGVDAGAVAVRLEEAAVRERAARWAEVGDAGHRAATGFDGPG